jgi:hypothetical protein
MMDKKNLIISAIGDGSRHREWISGNPAFDLILIYYGGRENIFHSYAKDALMCVKQKGQKFSLIKSFIDKNPDLMSRYDYVWLPDDDISISADNLNKLFNMARTYNLLICQPAVVSPHGRVSHKITKPVKDCKLRFTNFVEVMMPLFDVQTLLLVCDDFGLSQSGWGLDATWSHRLNDPKDKIAVIDEITAVHTKPVGADYSRFRIKPREELNKMLSKYNIAFKIKNYSSVLQDGSRKIP